MFKKESKILHITNVAIEWLIYFSVVLIPLVFMPQVNSVFTTPKLYIFRIITLLIILLWGVKGVLSKELKIRFTPFFWFVIAYGAVSIINTFVTANFYTSLYGTYGRFIGIFTVLNLLFWVYVIFAEFRDKEKIKKLMKVSVVTSVIIALYGLLQYFDVFVNIFPWSQDPQERLFATIGHSNHTAAYLGMNLMLALSLFFVLKKKSCRIFMLSAMILLLLTTVLTASRGGVFAVIMATVIWVIFIFAKKKLSKNTIRYSVVGLILASIIGILLSGPIGKLGVVERTVSTINFMQEGNVPDRLSWWLSSFEMIKDKSVLGHGLSTFKDVYNKYRRTDYRVPEDAQDHITPESAHNEYLNIAVTQGLLGFAAYMTMLIMLFVYSATYLRKEKDQKNQFIVLGLLTGTVVYMVQVFISFGTVTTLFIFFTLIGCLISYISSEKEKAFENKWIIKLSAIVFALFIFVWGVYSSFNMFLAEYYFKQAQTYAAKGDLELTLENFEKAEELFPKIPKYFEDHGNFLFEFAVRLPDEAQPTYLNDLIQIYASAVKTNQNLPSVLMNQGLVYSRLADLYRDDEYLYGKYKFLGISVMNEANLLENNNPFYPYKFGKTLKFYGEYKEALLQFEKVLKIRNPYKDTRELIYEILPLIPVETPEEEAGSESGNGNSEE